MRILLISSYLPHPLFSGGHIRLFNLLKELSSKHKITLICERRDYQTEKDVEEVGKFCQKVVTVPRKKQWSVANILKSGISSYPFLMVGHISPQMKREISNELNKGKYDLVHVETFYVMQNLPQIELPLVLAEQNIEHLVYKRFADQVNLFLKPFFYFDVLKMKYWEEKFWGEADQIIVTSGEERKIIGRPNVTIVSNGVDLTKFKIRNSKFKINKKEKRILFIGDFRWIENRDTVEWLLKEIWPLVRSKIKNQKLKIDLKLWIVGKEIPGKIKKLTNDKSVIFDENAPDETWEIYQNADLLLAPIRVGGGIKFKILEAMASGVPVVTTSIGIEGIEARSNEEILIADDGQGLVGKTLDVLQNKTLYQKLAKKGRLLIEKKYDWKIIVGQLEKVYEKALNS